MLIKKSEVTKLSYNIRKAIDGDNIDFRDNNEGALSILKNDIHTFVTLKNAQLDNAVLEHKIMSEYIENISHQLKTPITSMNIMLDLIEDAPKDKQLEFLSNIKTSLTQMKWLTTNLLKMAKLDNKVVEFSKKEIPVHELLNISLKPLEILLDIKNQKVALENDIIVNCDRKWTAEALTNIIKNALEHSKENSTITVNSGENPIYSYISVTDTGNGIKKEDYKKLFTRFENSHNKNGYGVGLPLALSIIRSQNGDIDVDLGGHGKGAIFTIKLWKRVK
ncbi:two-component sensor histidine kinase [Candidatus Epulonipiscium fishelsonii]|uniref:Two-component sensor histidine kinase n=1 Tax=Candidatus Epulonipiscium fishelsonii TaxID=77094 RepID=A0ACC8XHV1_9FIRM|nr:two-component sensor histidine kinase [Epulopiscium sp. SCG-D08WGA-EpuloA1]